MKFYAFILFFLLIVFGHELILNYVIRDNPEFQLTTLGFIWVEYSPKTYRWMSYSLEAGQWKMLTEVLEYKTGFVALLFCSVLFILRQLLGYFRIIDLRSGRERRREKRGHDDVEALEKMAAKRHKYFGFRRNR